jgi:predicted SnoaL-like aldol condensation-catalyzing enzyme
MSTNSPEQTKRFVLQAFDTLFNKRDYKAAERFFAKTYIQHSAIIEPGRDGLFNLVRAAPATLRYENARILAEGDYVMLHGRFTGNGQPRPLIAADVFRIADDLLVEHWDVLQSEVTKEESKSGLPMFGTSFAEPRTIVAPLYDALNQPTKKDVAALLAKATNPDYRSYSTNEDWLTRDQLAKVFKEIGSAIPDLRWTIKDIQTFGDQIVVRGELAGTPKGELFGAKPTGKSFKSMSIDVFTVKSGKLASAYHVENWVGALQQISK